ncbi:unnamed protein product [Medioppia subpectinata]|uniref:Uncharacterized protein n=1 Tax=Medioppia subpectinata TaxID=1979941 RepID=A0A7R9KEH5_9ACAR|nr:unnamed protein product [Medioppia subpectinata]CAG2101908.1 unnamed protein product [Medioppia subpectinata]
MISSVIPDTITSWFISAFAVDQETGLGIAPTNAKVTVFRPFFIKLSLPYSIIRGESVALQAIVFNYMSKAIDAEIVMDNKELQFEFTNAGNDVNVKSGSNATEMRKSISIPANDGVSVTFMITPKTVGYIAIKMTATTQTAGDGVEDKLLVKPEGQTQYFNKALLVDLKPNANITGDNVLKKNVSIEMPTNVVPGSRRVSVSGVGDIMGPTVNNLDQLLRMPFGCGEQNMLNFVPNIVVLDYLKQSNRLTPAIKSKATLNICSGYQRELTYRRDDGSFSAFGKTDSSGSTWLTAFVLKSFLQARGVVDVDQSVIDSAVEWLFNRQQSDGSFHEPGVVLHKDMQGGSTGGKAVLTAYVLIAILNDPKANTTRRDGIAKAEAYIRSELNATKSPYDLSIIANALHLANSGFSGLAFDKLKSLAKTSGDYMWWETEANQESKDKVSANECFHLPNSYTVETTAYGLLTLVARNDIQSAVPVLRWLISKQNSNGGFASTQDTVIGIQALGSLAQRLTNTNLSLNVNFNYMVADKKETKDMKIDNNNAIVLQRIQLPIQTTSVEVEARGLGSAIVQVSYQYNLAVASESPAFSLKPVVDKTSTETYLKLSVCTHYLNGLATNMAVMDVELPSGYVADVESLPKDNQIKRIDTTKGDTNVIVYFDKITKDEICLTIPAHRVHRVADNKAVPITVYDYYNRQQTSLNTDRLYPYIRMSTKPMVTLCFRSVRNSTLTPTAANSQAPTGHGFVPTVRHRLVMDSSVRPIVKSLMVCVYTSLAPNPHRSQQSGTDWSWIPQPTVRHRLVMDSSVRPIVKSLVVAVIGSEHISVQVDVSTGAERAPTSAAIQYIIEMTFSDSTLWKSGDGYQWSSDQTSDEDSISVVTTTNTPIMSMNAKNDNTTVESIHWVIMDNDGTDFPTLV